MQHARSATFSAFAVALALLILVAPSDTRASETYREPSDILVDVIDAPPTPWTYVSPDDDWLLLVQPPNLPPIEELAEEELRLAGYRIKPRTNGPSRERTARELAVVEVATGQRRTVDGLPEDARLGNVRWSPEGSRVSCTNTTRDGIELWVVDVSEARARRLVGPTLNLAADVEPEWSPDGRGIYYLGVPADRGEAPAGDGVPAGPTVQENLGRTTPARTYQDLLKDAQDEELFEHYFTAELRYVRLGGGDRALGGPALITDLSVAPGGEYVLVETLHRPFSYLVPAYRFPRRVTVMDRDGAVVSEIVDKPLQDSIPIAFGSVELGPRRIQWRHDAPATLVWAEALDGGDAGAEADQRDAIFFLPAPFDGEPRRVATLGQRFGGVIWGREDLALLTSWWWPTRTQRVWKIAPDVHASEPELLMEYSWQDRYSDPGNPVTRNNEAGQSVLRFGPDGESIFLIGDGASEEGDRPFLDRYDLSTGEKERLFHSQPPWYERPVELLDEAGSRLLVRRESVEEPPNYYVISDGERRQLTHFEHPTPQLKGVHKELIRYEREDGVQLSGTLYLPAGYDAERDGPLPVVMWAYPTEYKSADAAGQVQDSPHRFVRVGWWSPMLWLLKGYAVLDDPSMPIIGEGEAEPNDTYVEQLVSSAAAAIDELARRGVGDPERVAIGGHSYGAFMAANLLAHSDLFAAGVARSGAYNRTLTPFGFQAEERSFWEAPEVYFAMSPFMHADDVNEPILLIHGEADNNSGTFPMQSERYYAALKGLGATARLVMLPHESHGYRARESILHMLWETEQWLETYVESEEDAGGGSTAGARRP